VDVLYQVIVTLSYDIKNTYMTFTAFSFYNFVYLYYNNCSLNSKERPFKIVTSIYLHHLVEEERICMILFTHLNTQPINMASARKVITLSTNAHK